jgi:hypothetical protein
MISKSTIGAMVLLAMGLASPAFAQVPPGLITATPLPMRTPTSSRNLLVWHLTATAMAAGNPKAPLASTTISTRPRTTEAMAVMEPAVAARRERICVF